MPVSICNAAIIATLQPGFEQAVYLWINNAEAEGLPVVLVEGLRPYARQNALYAQGRTKPGAIVTHARAGQSYHQFGLAVDCVLTDTHGDPTWSFDPHGAVWQRVVKLAKGAGLSWGGDWRRFKDIPHFEPAIIPTLVECRRKWPKGWQPKGKP